MHVSFEYLKKQAMFNKAVKALVNIVIQGV